MRITLTLAVLGLLLALVAMQLLGPREGPGNAALEGVEATAGAGPRGAALSGPDPAADDGRSVAAGEPTPDDVVDPAAEIERLPPEPDAALSVELRWSDGAPAAGVSVIVRTTRASHGVYDHERRPSDASGVARFAAIAPGELQVCTDRTGWDPVETVTLAPGEEGAVQMTLPAGLQVAGQVLDDTGAPVAGAGIWLTSATGGYTAGAVVTRSNGGGNFTLRDLPGEPSLGALVPGHLPSPLVDLELLDRDTSPVRVVLRVTRGGAALVGRVTDAEGLPVPDAVVVLGANNGHIDTRADDTIEERWKVRSTRTDVDGAFRLDALFPGEETLRVRAPRSHAPRLGVATRPVTLVAGEVTRADVTLLAAAVVVGTLRDGEGAPVDGGTVRALDRPLDESFLQSGQVDDDSPFQHVATVARPDGRFRLEGVPAGTAYLYAQEPRPKRARMQRIVRFTRTQLELAPGDEATWNPILTDGHVIAGVARYRDGTPLTGVFVSASRTDPSVRDRRSIYTEDGTFRFVQLADTAYDLRVQVRPRPEGTREPRRLGVLPDGEPVELVAEFDAPIEYEPSRVVVRFVDSADRAPEGSALGLLLEPEGRFSWYLPDREDELWVFTPQHPGRHRVVATTGDRAIFASDWFDVPEGAEIDLGTFESVPGADLVVTFVTDPAAPPEGLRVRIRPDACTRSESIEVPPGASELRLTGLLPGGADVVVTGGNVTSVERRVELVPDAPSAIEVALTPAVRVPYEVTRAPGTDPGSMRVRFVHRTTGDIAREVSVDDLILYSNPIRWSALLAPGPYTFEVTLGDGRGARQDFDVTSLDPDDQPELRAEF